MEANVAVYEYRSDGEIAMARLRADGINSRLAVDNEGGLSPGFYARYGVRLVVQDEDLVDAFASLAIDHVAVPFQVSDAMFKHAGWGYPEEACGLVAFDADGTPRLTICLTNTAESAESFTISPAEQFGATRFAESRGLVIGAVFHSHPQSDAYPSSEDIAGGADPGWLHFIVGPVVGRRPILRAFRLSTGTVAEVRVTIRP